MDILPENVSVRKLKKPKGFSHPLKTTEVISLLGLENIKHKFGIFYDNSKPKDFIFSIGWYGHFASRKNCGCL